MLITVIAPPTHAGQAGSAVRFDATGGTIGRAATNMLVLDDPERTVSRVHAQVVHRNGRFHLVDRGSNPLLHNGRPLGGGNEVMLSDGDRLSIGSFELMVSETDRSTGAGAWTPPAAAPQQGAPMGAPLTAPPTSPQRGGASVPPPAGSDPFADLLAEFAAPAAPPAPPTSPLAGGRAQPTAVDPFADLLAPLPSAAPPPTVAPIDLADLAPKAAPSSDSIDALFGLSGLGAQGDPLGDPLGGSGLGLPPVQPNTAQNADPLMSLMAGPAPAPARPSPVAPNHVSILSTAFELPAAQVPPVASPPSPSPVAMPPLATPSPAPTTALPTLPEDWDPLADLMPVASPVAPPVTPPVAPPIASPLVPRAPATPPAAIPVLDEAPQATHAPLLPEMAPLAAPMVPPRVDVLPLASPPPPPPATPAASPSVAARAAPAAPVSHAPSASDDELLAALVRGLGQLHKGPQQLTPELMERIGLLLRLAVEGTLQLLITRQTFKRELKADVTIIAAQANNPLKFSPSVEVALDHLLGTGVMRGFMGPTEAMADAYTDLRAHEFGVMVGMRAALHHMLERFTPEVLEARLSDKTMLDTLFSANRKAKLWDQFCALSKELQAEAEDDFHALFGKAFLRAYDEQVNQLAQGRPPGGGHGT